METNLNVPAYPIGEAARRYAAVLKPALVPVAKALGYRVGAYYGDGNPRTVIRPLDETSDVDRIVLRWAHGKHGVPSVVASVITRKRAETDKTEWEKIVNAMTFGVPDAFGTSVDEKTLIDAVRVAIESALADVTKREEARR